VSGTTEDSKLRKVLLKTATAMEVNGTGMTYGATKPFYYYGNMKHEEA
jgi:hypothetical protein